MVMCRRRLRYVAPLLQHVRPILLVWGLFVLPGVLVAAPVVQVVFFAVPVLAQADDINVADRSQLLELNALSKSLVERARGGRADATRFRIDATLYRESLRRLMLDTHDSTSTISGGNELYLQMVRMAALLNAAAECKTGRYITCPPELMRQLTAQQKLLNESFRAHFGATS